MQKSARDEFAELRRHQHGSFTRIQARLHGISDESLTSRCQSGRIQRIHRGVYADFTGPVPWSTRVWAGWLAYGPDAALAGETALRPAVMASREPAVVRLEIAVLTVASRRARDDRAIAVVLDAVRQRCTTAGRLLDELTCQPCLPRSQLLRSALTDAREGVQSFLEMSCLRRVERDHRLPRGHRQARASAGTRTVYRDVDYPAHDIVVELDGRAGHTEAFDRWRDMDRDNAAVLDGRRHLRFGYRLVNDPCGTAVVVAQALHLQGWPGHPRPCGPSCTGGWGV